MKPFKPRVLSAAMAGLLGAERPAPFSETLTLQMTAKDGKVVIQMPKPVQVLTLSPDQADHFAEALAKHAAEARATHAAPDTPQ